jgi:hypothetical protein
MKTFGRILLDLLGLIGILGPRNRAHHPLRELDRDGSERSDAGAQGLQEPQDGSRAVLRS